MKDNTPVLYPNEVVGRRVTAYAEQHSTPLPKHLPEYHAWACETQDDSYYLTSTFQAQNMVWLAKAIGAKRVLEIGVYVGFSAMGWSHAVGPDGKVTGLEFSPKYAKLAEDAFSKYAVGNVELIVGDALKTLAELNPLEPYDLIFIDAQKNGYPDYLRIILEKSQSGASNRLLRPGGIIVADNVLRRGIVADPSDENPNAVKDKDGNFGRMESIFLEKLEEFNSALAANPRVEGFLMPLYDGCGLGRLVD